MIEKIRLHNFKNFEKAELLLGPLTTLVGANASGKSNLREAFRFLHALSRNYTLADIMGEKWGEGGVLQWRGISGGPRAISYLGNREFGIEVDFKIAPGQENSKVTYGIVIDLGLHFAPPKINREYLYQGTSMLFDSHPLQIPPLRSDAEHLAVQFNLDVEGKQQFVETFVSDRPILSQLAAGVGDYGSRWHYLAIKKINPAAAMPCTSRRQLHCI